MDSSPRDIATRAESMHGDRREAFLGEACADDHELRSAVDRLLRMRESVTLDSSESRSPNRHASADNEIGIRPLEEHTWIGGFRVLSKLGEGAMGVVLLAEQQNPVRQVALKVLRPDAMTPARERRFEFETESLAKLRHQGIATIYESGRADIGGVRRPYFAMELVDGVSLDRYTESIPLIDRVRIFVSVCEAIEHAHSRGVLHRDLKPANIVVGSDGRAKVLDFGVATSVDQEQMPKELVGTLPYMSPEQLASQSDIDQRTDVYSMGVMLCEIMTGDRPHDLHGMTVADAREIVYEEPIVEGELLTRELSAIIRRAIAPHRDERYQSVSELGDDLRNYLAKRPVLALDGGYAYRANRFVARNRGLVTLAALAMILACAGVIGVSYQAARATRGWHQAEQETQRAELALAHSDAQRSRTEAINRFMIDMLVSADPESSLGEDLTVLEMLDMAARTLETDLGDHPDIQAGVLMALVNTYRSLGRFDEAHQYARQMLELCEQSSDANNPFLPDALRTLALIHMDLGEYEQAKQLLDRATPIVQSSNNAMELAKLNSEYARIAHGTGNHTRSFELWTRCEQQLGALLGEDHKEVLVVMHNRGMALKDLGRLEESERVMREVYKRRLASMGEDHPQTLAAQDVLAGVIQKQGRDEEAAAMLRDVVDRRVRVLGDRHYSTLLSQGNLGATLIRMGKLDEAEQLTRVALSGHRDRFGSGHSKTLILMGNLAYLLEDRGMLDEAASLYREVIELSRNSTGGLDPETWAPVNNLAMLLMTLDRADEAERMFVELLSMCDAALPTGHYYTALFRNNYAECLVMLGRWDDAQSALDASHPVLVATFGADHARVQKSIARQNTLDERRSSAPE